MTIRDILHTSTEGLRYAKMRSALTMLGIVIGIASVIVLLSIGESAQQLIIGQVEGIGSNLVFVVPGGSNKSSSQSPPASVQGVIIKTLVASDAEALKRDGAIKDVAPEVRGQARVVYENMDKSVQFMGVSQSYFPMRNFTLSKGFAFTDADSDSFNKVAVLGSEIAESLFGETDPINKNIRLKNTSFRVVGVLDPKGLGPLGTDQDNIVLIPLAVAQKQMLGINHFNLMTIQAKDEYTSEFAKERISSILRENHRITDPDKDDFTVRTQADALETLGTITSALTIFLAAIAAVSLIVGGIGIMNIMLVSVVERTKEIGLRKAVGATDSDIANQFLIESIFLTVGGGILGIIFGALLTVMAYFAVVNLAGLDWKFMLPTKAILLAVGVASGTGLVFGIYPARQAAKKSPIEALRYE